MRRLFVIFFLLVCGCSNSWAQQETPRTLRFISEWVIPPQQGGEYLAYLEKNVRPVLEKMASQGPILDWGIYATAVYDDHGVTHGYWFECEKVAGIDKVSTELAKVPLSPVITGDLRHHDYLLRTLIRHGHPGTGTNGYYYFNSTLIQPTKRDQWREWWTKYQKPMYDQFLADGLVTMYEIDAGEIHTMDPNYVYLIYVAPSAEAIDKVNAAFESRGKKRSPEEGRTMSEGYDAVVVAGSHRDYLARSTSYGQK